MTDRLGFGAGGEVCFFLCVLGVFVVILALVVAAGPISVDNWAKTVDIEGEMGIT